MKDRGAGFCEQHGQYKSEICKKCARQKVNTNIIINGRYVK